MLSLSSSPAVMSPAASSGQDSLAGTACLPTFYQNHAAAQPTVTELSHLLLEKQTREPLMATFGNVTDQTVKGTYMTAKEIIDIYASENGITYMFGNVQFPFSAMLIIVIGSGLLFMAFSIIWMEHYKKH